MAVALFTSKLMVTITIREVVAPITTMVVLTIIAIVIVAKVLMKTFIAKVTTTTMHSCCLVHLSFVFVSNCSVSSKHRCLIQLWRL